MQTSLKTGLIATAILACGAFGVAAETAATTATTTAVVGTTTSGDLVVKSTSYKVVPRPLTPEEITTFQTVAVAPPSPYAGWAVISADGKGLGVVTYASANTDGKVDFFGMLVPDGRTVQINNGVKDMDKGVIHLRFTFAELNSALADVPGDMPAAGPLKVISIE